MEIVILKTSGSFVRNQVFDVRKMDLSEKEEYYHPFIKDIKSVSPETGHTVGSNKNMKDIDMYLNAIQAEAYILESKSGSFVFGNYSKGDFWQKFPTQLSMFENGGQPANTNSIAINY